MIIFRVDLLWDESPYTPLKIHFWNIDIRLIITSVNSKALLFQNFLKHKINVLFFAKSTFEAKIFTLEVNGAAIEASESDSEIPAWAAWSYSVILVEDEIRIKENQSISLETTE